VFKAREPSEVAVGDGNVVVELSILGMADLLRGQEIGH